MLLRRHHIATLLQAMLMTLALASCVKDDLSSDTAGTDGSESTPYYLNVQLQFTDGDPSATRATRAAETKGDSLEYGNHNEHMIGEEGNIIILFKDKKLFGAFALTSLSNHEHNTEDGRTDGQGGEGSNKDNNVDDNIEALHAYSTKFPAEEESLFPNSCLVVLNCSDKIQKELKEYTEENGLAKKEIKADVNEILGIVWKETNAETEDPRNIGFSAPDRKYFTMTNSIYFDDKNEKVADIEIPKDCIAKTLMAAKPITVRVERMVAKFSFELPEQENPNIFQPSQKADMVVFKGFKEIDGTPELEVKKWRIALTGWNINALETENYLFKKIEYKDYFYGYSDAKDWNHPENYRSHWSEDPHYDYADDGSTPLKYPWQYRKAIDYDLQYYDMLISGTSNTNLLRNYSFNDLGLGKPANGTLDLEKTFKEKTIYTPENTYDANAVKNRHDSRDDLLAGTHLLVGAEVQIEQEDEDDDYFMDFHYKDKYKTPKHLFRDRNGFCYLSERECIASLVHDFNQLLESQSVMVFTHYGFWKDAKEENTEKIVETEGAFSLYYKKSANDEWKKLTAADILNEGTFKDEELKMAIATLRRGDGKRLPWIENLLENGLLAIGNNAENPYLPVYKTKLDNYGTKVADKKEPTQEDPTDGRVGTTKENNYIKSLLYEWLGAIDHFNEGKMYYSHGVVDNPPIEDYKLRRYGVVRNNWYQFKLSNVKNLGTPVDDLDQPIVPDRNGLNDQINFTIKILDWHNVSATLDKM